jgi:SOS response regulatory protein OraA/RecX
VGKDYQCIEARVWLRTAYISWVQDVKKEEAEKIIENLKRHGFKQAEIGETALPIK